MSDFSDNHITNLGSALLAQVVAGGTITFTRIVLGDGNMPGTQTPATMTDVVSPKAEASITKAAVSENQTAVIGARFTNESQQADFEWKELGLYAKGSDGAEVLYSYGYTPSGEIIPASGETLIEKLVDIVTYIGDAAEIDAVFDPSFIPQIERIDETDIEGMWDADAPDPSTGKGAQYLDRPGLSQLVHDIAEAIAGAGPTISADEVTVSMTAEGVLSIKASGVGTAQLADASVTTAKLADKSVTAAKLADGAITIDQIDTSSITPGAIGAAPADHEHDASDVATGTLPPERGGTGQASVQAARNAMGLGDTLGAVPIANGGTGAATAAGAFENIVVPQYPSNEDLLAYLGLS